MTQLPFPDHLPHPLTPAQRLASAREMVARYNPRGPNRDWLGAERIFASAVTEIALLRRTHPHLFPSRPRLARG